MRPIAVIISFWMLPGWAAAAPVCDLPTPEGEVILTISGLIFCTNEGDTAAFDLEMLTRFESRTIETETIWTEGLQVFTGVPLETLLEAVGSHGQVLFASAINDYAVEFPVDDWAGSAPVVAYHANGAPMSVRSKGPLWIVYPFDEAPFFQTEVIMARSIWQLDRIEVRP